MTIASLVIVMLGTSMRVRSLPGVGPRDDAAQMPPTTAAQARTLAGRRPEA